MIQVLPHSEAIFSVPAKSLLLSSPSSDRPTGLHSTRSTRPYIPDCGSRDLSAATRLRCDPLSSPLTRPHADLGITRDGSDIETPSTYGEAPSKEAGCRRAPRTGD